MTRPFDKHLDNDELDELVSSHPASVPDSKRFSEEHLGGARRHVESCQDCSQKVQMHKSVQSEIREMGVPSRVAPGPDCVAEIEWLRVVARLLPEARTRELMKHAAQCGCCGPLLRDAAETLSDEATPNEESMLEGLMSTHADWQEKLAEILRGRVQGGARNDAKSSWWKETLFWPRGAFTAAGIAVVVLTCWLGARMFQHPSAEQLLARAYTERRTFEPRIPGAKYAPIRVERGTSGSNLDKPPSLLTAEAQIGENLRKFPNDPAWLQAKARADLLDGNYESAIKTLQRALETKPDDLSLLRDLGSAHLVRAEATKRIGDYNNGIEFLSKVLASSPDDPIALFNRALACEQMFLYAQAVDDWEHYLRVEPQGEWSDDVRRRLTGLKVKLQQHENSHVETLLGPAQFSAVFDANQGVALAMLDRRVERYLDIAVQSWLPQAYGDKGSSRVTPSEARGAIVRLAEILKARHDDSWLAEFNQNAPDRIQTEALHSLLASDDALHSGRYGFSVDLAEKSVREFQRSKNQAGMLRASFALMLAQSFAYKFSDCLKTAALTIPLLSATRYRWLQSQTAIQQGQCQAGSARLHNAIESTLQGAETAKRFRYPSLELRAMAFAAAYRSDVGNIERGLRDLMNGIAVFWQSDVTSTRGENLYSVLFDVAGNGGWHHVEAFAINEEITDFPAQDPVDEAIARELLAGAEERAEEYTAAQATLQLASVKIAALPEDSGIILRRAQIALESAAIQLQQGDPNGATVTLGRIRQQFEIADKLFQSDYFKTYGEAYLAQGLNASAEPLLERALPVIKRALGGFRLESNKLQWSRKEEQIYRDLLEVKLNTETAAQAFAWWEWYKGASLRPTNAKASDAFADGSFAPPDPSSYFLPPGTVLISYVVLHNSTIAFVLRDGNVQSHILDLRNVQALQPLHFLSLCADPSVDLDSLNAEGRRLYQLFIAPLESDIRGATALRFEADGILDRIPFDLLRGDDGLYLADRFEISYSPGLAYGSLLKPESISPASVALIVVASGAQDSSSAPLPEATEEGNEVAKYFREATILSGAQLTRDDLLLNLRGAQVFHFVGHGLANVEHVGLMIGPDAIVSSDDFVKLPMRNLRLAVLSACNTANGEDGTFADANSIARTLAVAGVPRTVASRWNVDSVVARQLMRAFYSNLSLGKTPAAALRAATVAVRNSPGYQRPYYWGSFAVFGG